MQYIHLQRADPHSRQIGIAAITAPSAVTRKGMCKEQCEMFLCFASEAAHTALDFYGQNIFVEQTDYITFTQEGGIHSNTHKV
jgi:hypothetical protein